MGIPYPDVHVVNDPSRRAAAAALLSASRSDIVDDETAYGTRGVLLETRAAVRYAESFVSVHRAFRTPDVAHRFVPHEPGDPVLQEHAIGLVRVEGIRREQPVVGSSNHEAAE